MDIANLFWMTSVPTKREFFHTTRMSPEAPIEGRKQKHRKEEGKTF